MSYDEVADLRRSVRDLREDLDRAFGRGGREVRLEEGRTIRRPRPAGGDAGARRRAGRGAGRATLQGGAGNRPQKAGIGAVLGGVIGGIVGGRTGAIADLVLGGGGAVVATKGDDVELPAGAVLAVRLERPLVVPRR